MKTNIGNYILIGISFAGIALFTIDIAKEFIIGSFEYSAVKFGVTFYGTEALMIEVGYILLSFVLAFMGMRGCKQ